MPDNCDRDVQTPNNDLFVVGIGASAGGLSALEELFDNLSTASGAAFVVIQHLSPDFKSLMKELLERRTTMPVHRVTEGMKLQPNTVYLIPPGQNLALERNVLRLEDRKKNKNKKHELNFPIDLFLTSLAENYGERSIGIILSGSGSDGTRGLKTIKEAGGVALVQDPQTAEFDGMPGSAIATGVVDRILPPRELSQLIYQCIVSPTNISKTGVSKDSQINAGDLAEIARLLLDKEALDFSQYKSSTITRRIHRRCLIHNFKNIDDYLQLLNDSETERQILCSDLLINVTHFFRDYPAWQQLENNILPQLIEQSQNEAELRFWITACSTGEEAYSLAILVHEAIQNSAKNLRVKIFATDIDRTALEKASKGVYPASIARDVGTERLQKYFVAKDNSYQIMRKIREMLIFSPHDLTRDAGFTRIDLVTCRNVLIYMKSELQDRVLRNLHFSLVLRGVLFLGEADTLGQFDSEFETLDKKWKFFQKATDTRLSMPMRSTPRIGANSSLRRLTLPPEQAPSEPILEQCLNRLSDDLDSVILMISKDNHLLHVSGNSGKIFQPPGGKVTTEVTKMVVPPLQLPLNTALHRAKQQEKPVHYQGIKLDFQGETLDVSLKVIPPQKGRIDGDFFVVKIRQEIVTATVETPAVEKFELGSEASRRMMELENELQQTRENLQALVEELETTNEEQQASNEELTASNEELQSTNEELHSVNEELHTVNIEYQSKIGELTQLNDDVDNLLQSTEIGVIFLDKSLKIRKFTPAATIAIALRQSDLDRPLEELHWKFECPNLFLLLQEVLITKQPIELEVQLRQSQDYLLMQIHLYQTQSKDSQGLVISFVGINEIKQVQKTLEAEVVARIRSEEKLIVNQEALLVTQKRVENIFSSLEDAVWSFDLPDENLSYLNDSFETIYGRTKAEFFACSTLWLDAVHPEDKDFVRKAHRVIKQQEKLDLEYRIVHGDGSIRWVRDRSKIIFSDRAIPIRKDFVISDLTAQKQAQDALKAREQSFQAIFNSMFQFIGVLDLEGILLEANQTSLTFGGLRPEEVLDRPFWEAKWWTISEATQAQLKRAIATAAAGEFIRYEVDAIGAKDRVITIDFSLNPVFDETGEVVQIISEGRDVSELKQAREALAQTNLQLEQRVAERTQSLAVFSDRLQRLHRLAISEYQHLEDLFTDYLQAGCQMLNLATGIVSEVDNYKYKIVAVESPLALEVGYKTSCVDTYCAEVVETNTTITFAEVADIKSMREHPVYLNLKLESFIGTPIFVNGSLYGTLNFSDTTPKESGFTSEEIKIVELMAKDIGNSITTVRAEAALARSMARFRNTFEQAAVGVSHISPAGGFIKVNQRLCEISGYQNQDLLTKKFPDIIHPQDLSLYHEYLEQIVSGKSGNYSLEKRLIKSDRSMVWVNLTVSLVRDDGGEPDYFISVIEDISDRKQTEIALEQANQAKDGFIARMSHELRTPLSSILGFSQLLQKDFLSNTQKVGYAKIVYQSGQHLLDLINDILDFSKMSANEITIVKENFNFIQFLEQIIVNLSIRARDKDLGLKVDLAADLPKFVNGDFNRLRQVLYNLLSNAIKFTKTGDVTFRVMYDADKLSNQANDRQNAASIPKIRFEIKDTGIGISSERYDDIFVPFKQINNLTEISQGSGLGLSISQNIVGLMGSQIKLNSELDRGSTFWFDLELPEVDETLISSSEIVELDWQKAQSLKEPRRVLIVDDNLESRILLVNWLQPLGFIVAEADNGKVAIETANTFKPDIILTDLIMPVMDGKEMIIKLKQDSQLQHIPIFTISANSDFILKHDEIDCDEFLDKPIKLEKLLELLNNYLQLDWQSEAVVGENNLSIFEVPDREELAHLLKLANFGDMEAVEAKINSLLAISDRYAAFAAKTWKFTAAFQQDELESFLEDLVSK